LIVERWMPLASCFSSSGHLQEGIVGFQENENNNKNAASSSSSSSTENNNTEWMQMEYKVLNPSYATWPVYNHVGHVRFTKETTTTTTSADTGCSVLMEWTVQWTPLPVPIIPYWDNILTLVTTRVIETAGNYMATTTAVAAAAAEQDDDDAKTR
jgi:hypothetical protein